jgi:hypothetical protein
MPTCSTSNIKSINVLFLKKNVWEISSILHITVTYEPPLWRASSAGLEEHDIFPQDWQPKTDNETTAVTCWGSDDSCYSEFDLQLGCVYFPSPPTWLRRTGRSLVAIDGGDSIEVLHDGGTPEQAEDTERPADERLGIVESGEETSNTAKPELGHNSALTWARAQLCFSFCCWQKTEGSGHPLIC